MKAACEVCCHHCILEDGQIGLCHARQNIAGTVRCTNYGRLTALALDPIEKKPLAMYMPGSRILSVGSYGCSLRCPFCQNWEISLAGMPVKASAKRQYNLPEYSEIPPTRFISPHELCEIAADMRMRGNIGVAYTYNEPLVGWEYVRDTSRLIHEAGMKNVLVTNGMAEETILNRILPYTDAMNIDLKSFSKSVYDGVLGGDRDMVMHFIEKAVCYRGDSGDRIHVEITSLIVPGINDSEEEIRQIASWIASLDGGRGRNIPLHITRYFPRYKMRAGATDVRLIHRLAEAAGKQLRNVFVGNV